MDDRNSERHNNDPRGEERGEQRRRQGSGPWSGDFACDMRNVASDMGRMASEMGRMFTQFRPSPPPPPPGRSREARDHFRNARLEFLKGVRQVVDEQIEKVQGRDRSRGTSVPVD